MHGEARGRRGGRPSVSAAALDTPPSAATRAERYGSHVRWIESRTPWGKPFAPSSPRSGRIEGRRGPTRSTFGWSGRRRKAALITAALVLATVQGAAAETYTLESAIRTALANSKGLALAGAQVAEAKGRVREVDSGFYPKLEANGGYQYVSEVPNIQIHFAVPGLPISIDRSIEMGKTDNWQAKIQLTQPVFLGGAVFYGHRAARAAQDAAALSAGQTRNDLVAQVTAAFYGVVLARDAEKVVQAALDAARKHLADAQDRYRQGAASRADVLRAEVQAGLLEPQASQAHETAIRARIALRTLLGLTEDAAVDVDGELVYAPFTPQGTPLAEALKDRPELAALDAQRKAAVELGRSARAGWFPQVSAQAAYNWQEPWYFKSEGQDFWTGGVGLRVPLFDGLQTLGKTDQANAKARQVEIARAAQADRVRMEVDDAVARLFESDARGQSARDNVGRAEQALKLVEDGYREGVATNLDVLDANLQLLQARLAHLQAIYDHRLAQNDLVRAVGGYAKGE